MPGVYSFWDASGRILYVGKARNLRHRVTNYTQLPRLSPKIKKMVATAAELRFEILESELEALLIEAELIRLHQPPFNTLLKDDKSPLYLLITAEEFPRLLKVRKAELRHGSKVGTVLGPFPSSYKLQEVLKLARRIFPWCNQGPPKANRHPKACFYHHLDLCPGVCLGIVSAADYQIAIKELSLFLRGQKKTVVTNLRTQLKTAIAQEEFELAELHQHQIEAIKAVTSGQYRLGPELVLPDFHQSEAEAGLIFLQKLLADYLRVPHGHPLQRIEGYDVSNLQGKQATVSQVVLTDGRPDSSQYKVFNIKTLDTPNDYQMLKEALVRRQSHPEWGSPDLVVVDGGKGQVRAALSVWNWPAKVIGIAKDPDRLVLPITAIATTAKNPAKNYHLVTLPTGHPALKLIQQLRDEAHRFAQKQHHRLTLRALLDTQPL